MATQSACVSSILDRLFTSDVAPDMAPVVRPAPVVAPVVRPAPVVAPIVRPAPVAPVMVAVTGNTYPVKEQLKAIGARWSSATKLWLVPIDKADTARAIVAAAPKREWTKTDAIAAAARKRGETPGTCADCGARCKYPYSQCWDCRESLR